MTWTQIIDPVADNLALSALVALIPTLYFFWALAVKRMKGYVAGTTTLLLSVIVALVAYHMPWKMAVMASFQGALYGLLPIGWIIIPSVFLYKLTVKTGQFQIIRSSIVTITEDRRLQALLVAFSFGAFLEGAAGFGAPVAITAALLVGLGFNPLYAAGLCLIANTAPVAFGAIGIPIIAMEGPTGLSALEISKMVGRQLPFLSFFVPYYLVVMMCGFRKAKEVLPAIAVTGGSFALTQYLTSNFMGPELPDILSALVSLVALTLFLRVWKPKTIYRFEHEKNGLNEKTGSEGAKAKDRQGSKKAASAKTGNGATDNSGSDSGERTVYTGRQIFRAWSPFLVLTAFISVWGIPVVKQALTGKYAGVNEVLKLINELGHKLTFHPNVPGLHNLILDLTGKPIGAQFKLELLAAAGTAILLATIVTKFIVGIAWSQWFITFGQTINELKYPVINIMAVVGFAYVTNASGMSGSLGNALAKTGPLFPFFSPFLGWLGVFITGSDTSSNLLFGNLQKVTAQSVGMDPLLAVAANTSGGVTGKMISPQSIAVACASVGLNGKESDLFRFTAKHSFIMVIIIGLITYAQATVLTWMIP
ncbi:MAG: lactate permease [Paenibacillaceae bacterium]|jgi:lactate permease|nr:lactate permease [Paenibacillaceae bacterium]